MKRRPQSRFNNQPELARPALLSAPEAIALLGVKRATLYSYVSRGWIRAVADPDGAGNLYAREDLKRLRQRHDARAGHGAVAAGALAYGEPILTTAICQITAEGPSYRGKLATELAASGASFASVCDLLWETTGAEESRAELAAGALGELSLAGMLATAANAAATGEAEDPHGMLAKLGKGSARTHAIEQALILCADHELTASTFATRIAASTGASLWASLTAGLATLTGPRHGGAATLVAEAVDRVGKPEAATRLVAERLRQREAMPGFGHPLYPDGDPRGAALMDLAQTLQRRRLRTFNAIAEAVYDSTGERPSLDFGLAALVRALGLAPEAASALFGLGRSAGLIAHALEQRRDGRLLRPRARYLAASESSRDSPGEPQPASVPGDQSAPRQPARGR